MQINAVAIDGSSLLLLWERAAVRGEGTWEEQLVWRRRVVVIACWVLVQALCTVGPAWAQPAEAAAAALRARHNEMLPQLRASAFGEPLVLNSIEHSDRVEGDVHAEVDHSMAQVSATFSSPAEVCEFLFLHLNVHACRPSTADRGATLLNLEVGPKRIGAMGASYRMAYEFRVEAASASYLRATLTAATGPLSTSDYRIVFEAVPLDAGRSFVHLGYAYSHGVMAKLAMRAYLATAGRSKIGFTVIDRDPTGRPIHVRGERAALERNVIRYYLALLAHCATNAQPVQERPESRLRTWFALTERHAAQLHEFDLDDYLHQKRHDLTRARAAGG